MENCGKKMSALGRAEGSEGLTLAWSKAWRIEAPFAKELNGPSFLSAHL